jgi:hypothetical protein
MLAKHMGMLVERREVTGKDGAPIESFVIKLVRPDDDDKG